MITEAAKEQDKRRGKQPHIYRGTGRNMHQRSVRGYPHPVIGLKAQLTATFFEPDYFHMNTFNSVYAAVRAYCKDDHFDPREDCFKIIAHNAGVPVSGLEYFLNALQNLHLISYSLNDRCISLLLTWANGRNGCLTP